MSRWALCPDVPMSRKIKTHPEGCCPLEFPCMDIAAYFPTKKCLQKYSKFQMNHKNRRWWRISSKYINYYWNFLEKKLKSFLRIANFLLNFSQKVYFHNTFYFQREICKPSGGLPLTRAPLQRPTETFHGINVSPLPKQNARYSRQLYHFITYNYILVNERECQRSIIFQVGLLAIFYL